MNFIKTVDEGVAEFLRSKNYQELPKEGNFFVFVNNGKLEFTKNEKIVYTNKLSF